jgi:hypothetical protein
MESLIPERTIPPLRASAMWDSMVRIKSWAFSTAVKKRFITRAVARPKMANLGRKHLPQGLPLPQNPSRVQAMRDI